MGVSDGVRRPSKKINPHPHFGTPLKKFGYDSGLLFVNILIIVTYGHANLIKCSEKMLNSQIGANFSTVSIPFIFVL